MEDKTRFAGYNIMEFSPRVKDALVEVADRLIPHEHEILDRWITQQWDTWQPPGLSRNDLESVFGRIFHLILNCMKQGELEQCLRDLEDEGAELAHKGFSFQALIISIHFLEGSYLRFLLNPPSTRAMLWLQSMDEFLHGVLASVASAYFDAYRKDLLEEAEVGRVVQEGLLADIPKKTADLEVAHIYISAHERAQLGGDFLDSFRIDPRESFFLIGDLSGHGLEAAADSVMLRSLFRGFMVEKPDLADAMGRLNRVMEFELGPAQFATALAVSYQSSGKLKVVNAGHPLPIICDGACSVLEPYGAALGIDKNWEYAVAEGDLKQGATFVAFTDGLIEARKGKDLFGEERAAAAIEQVHNASARNIAEHLIDEALRHAGGKFKDDVAVLVLKRHKKKA